MHASTQAAKPAYSDLQFKPMSGANGLFDPLITRSRPGKLEDFIVRLQGKLDEKLDTPPIIDNLQVKLGK